MKRSLITLLCAMAAFGTQASEAVKAPPKADAARGQAIASTVCAACHGPEAKGMPALGAPDLTDDYWLYGRTRAMIREGLDKGRNGVMPAHKPLIGETPARLAAAYVWSLTHTEKQ